MELWSLISEGPRLVSVLQEGPFACLLSVSKHESLLFIIVKLALHP